LKLGPTYRVGFPGARGLALFGLIFCVLRLVGLDHGDPPTMYHADERHYAGVAARMTWDDLHPHRFENPPLLTYGLFAAGRLHASLWGEESTQRWINQGGLYRLARVISAVLGAATALVLAAAAARLGGARAGWAALCLVGFSFLHGRDSHFGVNDVPMTFLVAVVTWMSLRVLSGSSLRWAFSAALMAGLASATKYNGAIAVVLPVLAVFLCRERPRYWPVYGLALPVLSLVSFVVANPYALIAWDDFSAGFMNQYTRWGDNRAWGQSQAALSWLYGEATVAMVGWAHGFALLVGTGAVLLRRQRLALLLLAFPLLYLAGMLSKSLFFWRFALPLLPALALLAALGWDQLLTTGQNLVSKLRGGSAAALKEQTCAGWALALLLCASVWPAAQLLRLDQLLSERSTWLLARDWIVDHQPPGRRVFAAGFGPALPEGWEMVSLSAHLPELGRLREPGAAEPTIGRGGLVMTNSWTRQGGELEDTAEKRATFLEALEANFKLVAEFSPGPDSAGQRYLLDGLYAPLVELWAVDRPGPLLQIYRVPPGTWKKRMGHLDESAQGEAPERSVEPEKLNR
jgi:hypothetical protein